MTLTLILIGAILFVLGAVVSYFSGIRSLQASRKLADYRVRQRSVVRARWSLVGGFFSVVVAAALFLMNRPANLPAAPQPTATTTTQAPVATTVTSPVQVQATRSPLAVPLQDTPTFFVITPSPAATETSVATSTPSMPIAVQAMVQ